MILYNIVAFYIKLFLYKIVAVIFYISSFKFLNFPQGCTENGSVLVSDLQNADQGRNPVHHRSLDQLRHRCWGGNQQTRKFLGQEGRCHGVFPWLLRSIYTVMILNCHFICFSVNFCFCVFFFCFFCIFFSCANSSACLFTHCVKLKYCNF